MTTVCYELQNSYMKTFLQGTGTYTEGVVPQYDILFCDNVEFHDKTIKASKKVFLACDRLGYFDDVSKFEDFQYYIGFGKTFYQEIYETYGFECSTVLDGFVFNQALETGTTVPDIDFLIAAGNLQDYNIQSYSITVYHFCEYINFVKALINPGVVYGHNIKNFSAVSDYITANLSGRSSFTDVQAILAGMADYSGITGLECFQSKTIKNTLYMHNNNFGMFAQNAVSGSVSPQLLYNFTNNGSENCYVIFNNNRYTTTRKINSFPNFSIIQTLEKYLEEKNGLIFPKFATLELCSGLWKNINNTNISKVSCNDTFIAALVKIG